MTQNYTKSFAPGTDIRDVALTIHNAAEAAGIHIEGISFGPDHALITVDEALTPQQETALNNLAITVDPNAPWRVKETIESRAKQALVINDAFLAVASPNNAAVVAQVKQLTRQNSGVIRLLLAEFNTSDGT